MDTAERVAAPMGAPAWKLTDEQRRESAIIKTRRTKNDLSSLRSSSEIRSLIFDETREVDIFSLIFSPFSFCRLSRPSLCPLSPFFPPSLFSSLPLRFSPVRLYQTRNARDTYLALAVN